MRAFSLYITSSILSLAFIAFFRKLSLKFNLFKSKKGIPYIGGVSFSLAFIIAYLFYILINNITLPFQLIWLIIFSFIILVVEFIDDLKDFSLNDRVIIQIFIICLFLLYGKRIQIYFLPGWLNYILSFLWIMGITNAFNHLDIADALCGGVSLIITLAFLLVSFIIGEPLLVSLFLIFSAALVIFLLFNLPPARIYMGNSGSHFLGFIFAGLSMYIDYADYAILNNVVAPLAPIFILAFPIIDTLFLIFIRLRKGISPVKKSDDHIFLRLRQLLGYSTKKALGIIYSLTLIWCLVGIFIVLGISFLSLLFLTVALFSTLFIILRAST